MYYFDNRGQGVLYFNFLCWHVGAARAHCTSPAPVMADPFPVCTARSQPGGGGILGGNGK